MSNTKHTPGPWRRCEASEGRCICGLVWSEESDSAVAEIHADHTLGLATIHDSRSHGDLAGRIPDDERVANMRLIAAAPEMYAMLADLESWLGVVGYPGHSNSINILLKKVTGER